MPLAPSRADPAVRAIAASWRRLTGGGQRGMDKARRTLIACSGGSDSSGLVLALAAAVSSPADLFAISHIVHDMRPAADALADRDSARDLAATLGLPFAEEHIQVKSRKGNPEGTARRLRYQALASLAKAHGCPYVATAHHADDQLETILMALLRGSGLSGLSGAAEHRRLGSATLIRPALGLPRSELRRLCLEAGWEWREDATNLDTTRLRAALRHSILPQLEQLRPGASQRAARSAALLRDAAAVIADRVKPLLQSADRAPDCVSWPRDVVAAERPIILGTLLRAAAAELLRDRRQDRLSKSSLDPVLRELTARTRRTRSFSCAGLTITISPVSVQLKTNA